MNALSLSAILSCSIFLVACGSEGPGSNGNSPQNQEVQQPLEGEYKAYLRPVNSDVSGFIPSGAAEVTVKDSEIKIVTYLDDASKVQHIQAIFAGSNCPRLHHDLNGDGLVDIRESLAVTGKAVIPLDSELSSEATETESFPFGSAFTYQESTRLEHLLADVYGSEETGLRRKLPEGSPFNLAGRVVLVLGTADLGRVPESVATLDELPRNLSIPVACGVLKRLE